MKVTLFPGPDQHENEVAVLILQDLPEVEIEVAESLLLEGRVILPFIETDEGERRFGISSIRQFVSNRR